VFLKPRISKLFNQIQIQREREKIAIIVLAALIGTAIIFMIGLKDIMGISKISAASSYRFLVVYWLLTVLVAKLFILIIRWPTTKGWYCKNNGS
jgi:ABC-type arginine/histidine transport system permease subunit